MDLGIGLGVLSSALLTAYIIVANTSERLNLQEGRFWSAAREVEKQKIRAQTSR